MNFIGGIKQTFYGLVRIIILTASAGDIKYIAICIQGQQWE